ncbi:MAG: ATP-dependent metallopeptidase FtsH/Yme1/Tma family protein, partial [Anaerolineales bacterium]|nr:ATP-dependent metallopeptidase FtsH/Yme1/Tma family protein [Anaerolineales bacterium]
MNTTRATRWFIYLLMGVVIIAIVWSYNASPPVRETISISQLAREIQNNAVSEVHVAGDGQQVIIHYVDLGRQPTESHTSGVSSLEELLASYGVTSEDYGDGLPTIQYEKASQMGSWL